MREITFHFNTISLNLFYFYALHTRKKYILELHRMYSYMIGKSIWIRLMHGYHSRARTTQSWDWDNADSLFPKMKRCE